MQSADGSRHIILNGEIYNYLELRAELEALGHRFRTRSDTEVLLEAWGVWGPATLTRIVGMFAFALLDERRGVLVLARDPFAIKPLYYARANGFLAFASEIPPLLDQPGVTRRAHPGALADFLTRGVNNHEGRTMFADVRDLPGACYAEVELEALELREQRYWQPPDRQTLDLSFGDAAEKLRDLLDETVRFHLRSDVPVGFLLSGGLDSTSVLCTARRLLGSEATLHSFSYRGGEGVADEGQAIDAARRAARAIGHDVRLTPEDWAAEAAGLVRAQGEPFGSPVVYAQRRLFQRAGEAGVRVVLDGQGSDEYLGGYDRFYPGRLASLLHQGRLMEFGRVASGIAARGAGWMPAFAAARLRWPALRRLRRRREHDGLLRDDWPALQGGGISPAFEPTRADALRETLGASLRGPSIPWLMRYADRNAMAFSIENRVPFLTTRLVDFVLGLPEEYGIGRDGTVKTLLRAAMQDRVPTVISARRLRMPFDVPVEAWLARTPGLQDQLHAAETIPAVRIERVRALRGALSRGEVLPRARAFEAWRLTTLARWADTFGVVFC